MCAAKEIGNMNKQGMQALAQGNFMNAEFMLHQALRRARTLGADAYTAKLENNLALALNAQGKKTEAAALLRSALATIEKRIGTQNKLYGSILRNLEATGYEVCRIAA